MKKQILFICCAVIAYCLSACNTAPQQAPLKEKNLPKHVILIGFDGLSAHCLNNGADMPTFRKMMAEGASTLENRSILPSSSACNWASMFMGAGPELHGYTEWGSRTPELPSRVVNSDNRFPNIFGLYRDKAPEAEIGYIYEWEGMNYLVDTLAMSFRKHASMSAENPNGCTPVAVQYIKEKKPNLCAIIYDQPPCAQIHRGPLIGMRHAADLSAGGIEHGDRLIRQEQHIRPQHSHIAHKIRIDRVGKAFALLPLPGLPL